MLAKIGTVAYRLQLPADSRIHPVFHVSLLRAALGPCQQVSVLPPDLTEDLEWLLTPKNFLDIHPGTNKTPPQALIKWTNMSESEATWEDFPALQQQFPHFHLEDKVRLWAGGIDHH